MNAMAMSGDTLTNPHKIDLKKKPITDKHKHRLERLRPVFSLVALVTLIGGILLGLLNLDSDSTVLVLCAMFMTLGGFVLGITLGGWPSGDE